MNRGFQIWAESPGPSVQPSVLRMPARAHAKGCAVHGTESSSSRTVSHEIPIGSIGPPADAGRSIRHRAAAEAEQVVRRLFSSVGKVRQG